MAITEINSLRNRYGYITIDVRQTACRRKPNDIQTKAGWLTDEDRI